MILSGIDIRGYIRDGALEINPVTDPDKQFQQNGFDCFIDSVELLRVDPTFFLACTKETFSMPDDLMAIICIKSSWARKGFIIAPVIVDAGFKGNLTISVTSHIHAPNKIVGERFIHLIFSKTSSKCIPYAGKYQGQSGITGAKE